ncbi:ATP-binding cassette domain-containing protein [Citricoccus sp. NPDC079358]|uniref:ABC transporter ATP-binding protein n=1 Tax=Citricoccus parietis TaxID=592307 RepID=A0ABV6F141_9MICC
MSETPDTTTAQETAATSAGAPVILRDPLVVIDRAGLTYTVRTRPPSDESTGMRWTGRVQRMRTTSVEALKPLSLVVRQGESVGIVGTNGSGKSSLMNLITGRLRPTTGIIHATSTPIMLGVNAALVRTVSGDDNITLGCLAMGMTPAQVEAKRPSIVELCGLKGKLHLPLKSYSSGMASRLQFAIATSIDPEILIIDEALNTGDAQFRSRTQARIDELRQQAGCVFLVSHSLGTIKNMCTRVIWIEQGELIMDGEPDTVTAHYRKYTKLKSEKNYKKAAAHRRSLQASLAPLTIAWR